LLDFVDGRGNEALHAEVERHLTGCGECETFSSELSRSLAWLRRAPVEALDDTFNWKVRLAIHREQKANARGTASAGAWIRAWNLRYVASTGVAFALVLVAGVVTTRQTAPSLPASSTSIATHPASRVASPMTPSMTPNPAGNNATLRSVGSSGNVSGDRADAFVRVSPTAEVRGAIDRYAQEVAMDSIIDARLGNMTPEMRTRCIRRQIHRLQSQLENQEAPLRAESQP
jgi:hypothetical protein